MVISTESISIIGTDDTTTCMSVVLRHIKSGVVGLGHFDGSGLQEGVESMCLAILELSESLNLSGDGDSSAMELHIVGGFNDTRGYSRDIAMGLLRNFHRQRAPISLVTASVCELNTIVRNGINCPIIYGIGVDVKSGKIFPAKFPNKGPDVPLRSSRTFVGHEGMFNIYDPHAEVIRIPCFNYKPLRGADLWLTQPDEVILNHLSTSPEVEPSHFVAHVREALKFIYQNPFPAVTVFPDSKPRYFKLDCRNGQWNRVAI